ncbi:zinc finger FYVE domain-containing protein 26 [Sapajus apella]|uniref:Zinc finger FYVE domain-containing protein 26 n=1 Tax=Sapajus apella TaxID=9515 RepID=A0A6J3F8H6_SAPAP|nr:zinc finger FYVE domain-containing protein 26 [Sapajus apella]
MNHPFGKEEAASQKQLFGFFCECLRRGEWELAQACVPQLHDGQGDIPKRVEDILQALVVCPNLLRCGRDINPQRLAWVWLLVLEKWLAQEKKLLPAVFRRKLEFLLLSEDLQGDIPETILQELCETLSQGSIGPGPDGNPRRESWTPRLSSEAVSVLWDLLRQSPQPAQALLELLLGENDGTSLCHWPLQNALVDLIRKALRALQGPDSAAPPGVVDAIYAALQTLRCPAEPFGAELRLLCEELLEACRTEGSPLREERVLSCLLHKASRGLVSLYGHTYAEKVTEKPSRATASGKVSPDHLDPERAMLALFSNPDPAQAWKVAYFYCLNNNKHFLEQILVTALTLLKEEDFPNLGCLLDREFRPLSCLLVLLGWTHCQSLESAKRLLQTLHRTQDPGCDELLRDACDGLWAHLEVLEWCIQQSSNPIPKRDLLCHLHGGDSHSVLYTLHHLTNLPALREEDVLKLLQKVPAKDPQQEPDAVDAAVPEHLSQSQNLTLYQGFCAMKYAIYALCVNSHQHSQCQDCKDSICEDLASAAEQVNDSLSSPGAVNLFSTYLAKCQQYLCSIPDSLCLELLENIFSLLLITSADLHPEPHLPEDYAEDDDIEGKSPAGLRSPSESPQHIAHPERKSEWGSLGIPKSIAYTVPSRLKAEPKGSYPGPHRHSFLDLKHFTSGISGFLADEFAIGAFLRLLQEKLDEISSRNLPEKPKQEGQSCSGSRDGLQSRLHRLSKVLSEAQWRYKVVTSNRRSEEQPSRRYRPALRHPSLRRGRRTRRSQADGQDKGSSPSLESTSSELSTSTSEGSLSTVSGQNELDSRLYPHPQSSLIPMMFSPPESLLASCILRGNFTEARQVRGCIQASYAFCFSPSRLAALLAQENLSLSVPQVIVGCCCEPLALCSSRQSQQTSSLLTRLGTLAQLHASHCLDDLPLSTQSSLRPTENPTLERKPYSSPRDSSLPALTSSTLAFLKSRSKLLALVACLGASPRLKVSKPSLWKELRGRREVPLAAEQVARECERLLEQFPLLEAFLLATWGPLQASSQQDQSLALNLCGWAGLSTVLLGLHSPIALDVLTEAFEESLVVRDWSRALQLTEVYGRDVDNLSSIKDAILSCAAACDKEGWQYLFPVKDASLRSRLALQFVDRWPLESCLEILAYCISDTAVQEGLKCELQRKLAELRVYQKILGLQSPPAWCDWQTLRSCCVEDPSTVMNMILEAQEYELCEEWGCLYPIPREHLISLHQKHLLHLLERRDHEKALQLLQRIPDPTMCLEVTEQSLDQHTSLATSHFLANYLTTHFYGQLTIVRHREIQALYVGSKILLTLPEQHRASYSHLSSNPLLMLEQLLMNMKVDWATVAVRTLQQLLVGQEIGFTMEEVDSLLSRYAEKALDFPYSQREKRSDSVIHLQEIVHQASDPETLPRSPSAEFPPASPGISTVHSPSLKERSFPPTPTPLEFVPPATPPARHQWVPDETESICMVCCREHFTMFNRRHHCRRCGRLVCSSCSTKKMAVEGCRENPARVCDQCYSYCNKDVPEEASGKPEALDSSKSENPPYSFVVRIPKADEVEWILDLKEEENELVRSEFYYEQAPSASLCIAILNLHRDSVACGHQLIEHCCRLSKGLTNPEVDAGLLTDIMKQLLFSAKMMFVKAGQSQDLALCDSYISKVDVLNILVAAAYRHVPSLDQILQPAAVTRLRNQLLEAEYYQLGVEVSTKTGLDTTGAWHAWGMACLKAGNLTAAREKFSRCLKPPFDLNQLSHGSRLVQDVVEYLESTVRPLVSLQDDDYFATLRELEATLRTQSLSLAVIPEGKIMNNTYYQECLFYLHNYSTNLAIISFYVRHSCLREALLHLLNKESPPEVFIEGIFQPSYKSGKLHTLENLLESIDPTLESWGKYLIAACQHLQKKNYYHILYELQQFMKDQVRAAMTCIWFFSHKAKSYTELGEKLSWLLKAKDHLKIYLQETSRSSGRKKTAFFRKKMTAADVSRHMNTLQLQTEVTRFLHRCESAGTSQITTLPLPTLFGNNHMKMDVACKVMLGGKNVEDGFGIAFRVLQDFQLDAAMTYCRAARQLVEKEKYSEIRQLLKCVSESGMAAKSDGDTILLNCLEAFKRIPPQELEGLIQAIHNDDNKVRAYLLCCKLRSAYLIAVKQEHSRATALVQQVQQAAKSSGDAVVQDICAQWLLTSHPRSAHGSGSRK